jgi:4-diphosphocytidyl-2C-methyl-D-erythritol kinase
LETKEGFVAALSGFANDFEPAVTRTYPVIGQIKQALVLSGAVFSSLTGSGSALFGIFLDQPSEREINRRLQVLPEYQQPNLWRVIVTRPVIAAGPVCASPDANAGSG